MVGVPKGENRQVSCQTNDSPQKFFLRFQSGLF